MAKADKTRKQKMMVDRMFNLILSFAKFLNEFTCWLLKIF